MINGQRSEALRSLQQQFPGVEFRGTAHLFKLGRESTTPGKELNLPEDWPLFRVLIQAAYDATQVQVEWRGIRDDIRPEDRRPHFVFELAGFPEAATRPTGQGSVTISLGLLLALGSAPYLFRALELLIREFEERTSIDLTELGQRYTDDLDPRLLDELVSLMSLLHDCERGDWAALPLSYENATTLYFIADGSPIESQWPSMTLVRMAQLTSLHEIGHWHMERLMSDSGREQVQASTRIGLEEWLRTPDSQDPDRVFATPEFARACADALSDNELSDSWVRELCADQLAVGAALNTSDWARTPRSTRMRWYADVAVYFFLLELYEYHQWLHGITAREYPPVRLRRSFTAFVLRNTVRQSEDMFFSQEWSIGFVVTFMTRMLKAAMVERLQREPERIGRAPVRSFRSEDEREAT